MPNLTSTSSSKTMPTPKNLSPEEEHPTPKLSSEDIFKEKLGFKKAIEEQVLPSTISISQESRVGSAAYFAPGWLITNQHVVSHPGSMVISGKEVTVATDFIRPSSEYCPDIAIIKTTANTTSLNMFSVLYEAHPKQLVFFLDNNNSPVFLHEKMQVKFEKELLRSEQNPEETLESSANHAQQHSGCLIYDYDGNVEPGCSGSPIICLL